MKKLLAIQLGILAQGARSTASDATGDYRAEIGLRSADVRIAHIDGGLDESPRGLTSADLSAYLARRYSVAPAIVQPVPSTRDDDECRAWMLDRIEEMIDAGAAYARVEVTPNGEYSSLHPSVHVERYSSYAEVRCGRHTTRADVSLREAIELTRRALGLAPRTGDEEPQEIDALAHAIAAVEGAEACAEDASDWACIADSWARIAREQRKRAE